MTESDKPDSPSGGPETPRTGPGQPPPAPPHYGAPGGYPPPYPYQPGAYQPGGYPGSYPPPPPAPYSGGFSAPPTGPKNGLGIAALIIAIVALVSVWSVFGGIILGIVAVVIGFAARGRVKRGEANNGGIALAGILLGFLAIIVGIIFIPIWISVFNQVGGTDYVDCLQKAGSDQNKVQQCADQFRNQIENQFSVTLTPSR
ncbi:MAG: hypothetical protein JWR37_5254 [Mycobacterium sp.]|nr:hypothetical protein [Mycobacterium sp.]